MKPGSIPPNPFGGTNDLVKMNPPVESPDLVEPAGPTDPDVSILAVQSPEGRPIALLANYSLHYVGTSRGNDISADYYGAFCDRLRQLLGADRLDPPFVALLANGTSGDINNVNFRQKQPAEGPYEQINFVADSVAREAHRVCQTLEFRDWVPLSVAQKEIKLGVRLPGQGDVARAERILALGKDAELKTLEQIYARETVLLKDYPPEVPLIIQTMRIGDWALRRFRAKCSWKSGWRSKRRVRSNRRSPSNWRTVTTATCRRPNSTNSAATKPGGRGPVIWKWMRPQRF